MNEQILVKVSNPLHPIERVSDRQSLEPTKTKPFNLTASKARSVSIPKIVRTGQSIDILQIDSLI